MHPDSLSLLNPRLLPIERKRYPKNWIKIAEYAKQAAGLSCQHCLGIACVQGRNPHPSPVPSGRKLPSRCQNANFTPEDNSPENLPPLCTPCHKALHGRSKRSNVSRPRDSCRA